MTGGRTGVKSVCEGFGPAGFARVEVKSGLDGIDEGPQRRSVTFVQQDAEIVDDCEGILETRAPPRAAPRRDGR